jgi:2-methylcitrate dehydratase PrpD
MTFIKNDLDAGFLLAEFASTTGYDVLPKNVVEQTKMILLDTIGVMLGATTLEEAVMPVIDLVKEGGGKEESTIIGFGGKVPCWMAAFANGALSHALDYSSSNDRGLALGGVTVPCALALAERFPNISGKQLITAIAMGNEVLIRIGGAITRNPIDFGWVSPMLLGVFGSAVAAGKMAGLDQKQMADSIGIALHQAGGTWEMAEDPDSTFRAIRNSFVNKTGVLAALLAQKGISGAKNPLEGENGLYHQYFQGHYDPSILVKGLGSEFRCANISFKPYPSCRGTHNSIDAALKLVKKHNITPEEISGIQLTVGPMRAKQCFPPEQRSQPQTSIEAKFSLPFTVAAAIARGKVTLADFSSSKIKDPVVLNLARQVKCQVKELPSGSNPGEVEVGIKVKDGRVFCEKVDTPYGNPKNPMSREELIEKFRDCANYSVKPLGKFDVDAIIEFISNLEHQSDLSKLMKYIS